MIGVVDPNSRGDDGGAFPLRIASCREFDGLVSTLLLTRAGKNALNHEGRRTG